MREYIDHDQERRSLKSMPDVRSYIAAILLLFPTMKVQSEDTSKYQRAEFVATYEHKDISGERVEAMASYEQIFKDGIKRALNGINSIDQIPVGGKTITYYRDSGNLAGKPMSVESVKRLGLPEKFDISPRKIGGSPVSCMYFTLGNRIFSITPDIGKIKSITLNSKALVIEISALFGVVNEKIIYDKQEKLPDLMFRLRLTPKGKGEKSGFRSTTVEEI